MTVCSTIVVTDSDPLQNFVSTWFDDDDMNEEEVDDDTTTVSSNSGSALIEGDTGEKEGDDDEFSWPVDDEPVLNVTHPTDSVDVAFSAPSRSDSMCGLVDTQDGNAKSPATREGDSGGHAHDSSFSTLLEPLPLAPGDPGNSFIETCQGRGTVDTFAPSHTLSSHAGWRSIHPATTTESNNSASVHVACAGTAVQQRLYGGGLLASAATNMNSALGQSFLLLNRSQQTLFPVIQSSLGGHNNHNYASAFHTSTEGNNKQSKADACLSSQSTTAPTMHLVGTLPQSMTCATTDPKRHKDSTPTTMTSISLATACTPTDRDVLCGRGTRSNIHPGNQRYLKHKERMRRELRNNGPKKTKRTNKEKLADSMRLQLFVESNGGRFLKLHDDHRWYPLPEEHIHRKCAQALREENTPASRRAKRERYSQRQQQQQQEVILPPLVPSSQSAIQE